MWLLARGLNWPESSHVRRGYDHKPNQKHALIVIERILTTSCYLQQTT
jgi:hypothetical protein